MKRLFLLLIAVSLTLTGCAVDEYARYAEMQERIQVAKYTAEAERYKAMAAISMTGDTATKVAAMITMGGTGQASNQTPYIPPPKTTWENTKDILGIFLPAFVQGYGIYATNRTAQNASNNSRLTAISTNDAFVGMANRIQAPGAVTTTNTTYTLSGNGVIGSGTHNELGGNGVIGQGTYTNGSYNPNTVTDRHDAVTTNQAYSNAFNYQPLSYSDIVNQPINCNVSPCP